MGATNRYETIRLIMTSEMIALSATGDKRLRRERVMGPIKVNAIALEDTPCFSCESSVSDHTLRLAVHQCDYVNFPYP